MLTPLHAFFALSLYFITLLGLSYYRSRSATLSDYLIGSRNSTWWLITLGMISDSVSGVTYVSVPGAVSSQQYAYLQVVIGYFLGYLVITFVLLPLYYQKNLISIYAYLGERFGPRAQKTGSLFFIASRTFGSAARLFISVMILHQFLLAPFSLSPIFSFALALTLIVLYTYKGGIKSLVWTEAYQSVILLLAISALVYLLWQQSDHAYEIITKPQVFFTDPLKPNFFLKQILGGMLITSAMNGLDQNIMQLNLSCKKLWDAQKNMLTLAFVMLGVNFIFMVLGSLTQNYYSTHHLTVPAPDQAVSQLVLQHLGALPSLLFIVGLAAATFSSAGTILPSIASSIEIDLLPIHLQKKYPVRFFHLLAAVLIFILMVGIYFSNTKSLIDIVLRCSGYTYGPLLGLYGIGIFTGLKLIEKRIPLLCISAIVITALLDLFSAKLFNGYHLGVELIALNALLFILLAVSFAKKIK